MNSATVALVVFVCIFGGALCGLYLRIIVPETHLKDDTLAIVKLATGLIATMSALVLGLLISSAKGTFDRVNDELVQNAARVLTIDHLLGEYGPQTRELRAALKREYTAKVDVLTSGDPAQIAKLETAESMSAVEIFQARLSALAPADERQRALRERMIQVGNELASTRVLVFLQKEGSIPMPMLAVLTAWLSIIFGAFGLCAPRNHTTVSALFVASLCAAGAIFLILELDRPLDGFISLREVPLRAALKYLGR